MRRLALALALGAASLHGADTIRGLSRSALPLQNQPASARSGALGGATVALSDDAASSAFNPGLLDALPLARFSLNHNQWLVDTTQEDLAMAFPAGAIGSLGASLNYVDYGQFQGRDATGAVTDNYGASELGLGLGWGRNLQPGFFAGLGIRGLYQNIAQSRQFAAAADLGIFWQVPMYDFNLGASYRGLGSSLGGAPLASGLRVGMSKPVNFGNSFGLMILGGFSSESGDSNRLQLGLECVLLERLALRAGYSRNMADPLLGGQAGMNLGLGFNLGRYRIDYAFQPYGVLGDSHKIGIEVTVPPALQVDSRKASTEAKVEAPAEATPVVTPSTSPAPLASPNPSPTVAVTRVATPTPSPAATASFTATPTLMPTVAPEKADAQSGKAFKVIFGEDEMDAEETGLRAAIKARPESWVAWRKMADYLFKQKRKAEAIEAYEKTLALHADADLTKWFENYKNKK